MSLVALALPCQDYQQVGMPISPEPDLTKLLQARGTNDQAIRWQPWPFFLSLRPQSPARFTFC
jgi:hypothetical protein